MTMTEIVTPPSIPAQNTSPAGSLVDRARALYDSISARTEYVEENRQVHPDSIQEMVDAGLTRGLQSAVYGGAEANPAEFYQAVSEVAKACTSTGWILIVLGVHSWEMAHMSTQLNDELFAEDPTTLISSSYNMQGNVATRVPGGYRLTGSWRSSSGVLHSKWVVLGANVAGESAPHNFVIPMSEVKTIDDWHVMGLAGTGSRSVAVEDVFIPDHRAIDRDVLRSAFGPGLKHTDSPTFRVPHSLIYTSVSSAPVLGAGWRFYEEFKSAYGISKTVSRSLGDDRLMLTRLAEARGNLSVAGTVPRMRLQAAYDAACGGRELGDLEVAQAMYDVSRNGKLIFDLASSLFPTLRPNSVYKSSIMQHLYRDILVARSHGTANIDDRGQAMAMVSLGLQGEHTMFLPPARREAARQRAEEMGYL